MFRRTIRTFPAFLCVVVYSCVFSSHASGTELSIAQPSMHIIPWQVRPGPARDLQSLLYSTTSIDLATRIRSGHKAFNSGIYNYSPSLYAMLSGKNSVAHDIALRLTITGNAMYATYWDLDTEQARKVLFPGTTNSSLGPTAKYTTLRR